MKKIKILGNEYNIESWWNWVCVDENGETSLFYRKPTFEYWNGYSGGRFWDILGCCDEWKDLDVIEYDGNGVVFYIGKKDET